MKNAVLTLIKALISPHVFLLVLLSCVLQIHGMNRLSPLVRKLPRVVTTLASSIPISGTRLTGGFLEQLQPQVSKRDFWSWGKKAQKRPDADIEKLAKSFGKLEIEKLSVPKNFVEEVITCESTMSMSKKVDLMGDIIIGGMTTTACLAVAFMMFGGDHGGDMGLFLLFGGLGTGGLIAFVGSITKLPETMRYKYKTTLVDESPKLFERINREDIRNIGFRPSCKNSFKRLRKYFGIRDTRIPALMYVQDVTNIVGLMNCQKAYEAHFTQKMCEALENYDGQGYALSPTLLAVVLAYSSTSVGDELVQSAVKNIAHMKEQYWPAILALGKRFDLASQFLESKDAQMHLGEEQIKEFAVLAQYKSVEGRGLTRDIYFA